MTDALNKHMKGEHDQSDHGSWAQEKILYGMTKENRKKFVKEINDNSNGSVEDTIRSANQWLMKKANAGADIEFGVAIDPEGRARDVFIGGEGAVQMGGVPGDGFWGKVRGRQTKGMHFTHLHPYKEGNRASYKPLSAQDVFAAFLTRSASITAVTPQGFESRATFDPPEKWNDRRKWAKKVLRAVDDHELNESRENWAGLISDQNWLKGIKETRQNVKDFMDSSPRSQRVRADNASRKADAHWVDALNAIEGVTYTSGRMEKRVNDVTKVGSYASGMDDMLIEGEIAKVDEDRRQVFGWASITEMNGEPVVDLQGDLLDTVELEKAAYDYVLDSRVGGEMHERVGKSSPKQVGTLIESFVVTPEKIEKMGLPPETPKGWWIGFQVAKDDTGNEVWDAVKKGKYTGFSIHGVGKRTPVSKRVAERSPEEIMGWTKRVAESIGIPPKQFASEMASYLRANKLEDPDDDDLHEFIMETYGSGEMLAKHLIGGHRQKDHDPTKKGKKGGHSRDDHSSVTDRWDGKANPNEWAGAGAGIGGVLGAMSGAKLGPAGLAAGALGGAASGAATGYQAGGGQFFGNPQGSRIGGAAAGFGNFVTDPTGTVVRRILYGNPNESLRKQLVQKAAERASTRAEFADNLDEIAKAFEGRNDEMATYFTEVKKHLVGQHKQKDHDPTKKGKANHARSEHKELRSRLKESRRRHQKLSEEAEDATDDNRLFALQDEAVAGMDRMAAEIAYNPRKKSQKNPLRRNLDRWMRDTENEYEEERQKTMFGDFDEGDEVMALGDSGEWEVRNRKSEENLNRARDLRNSSNVKLLEDMERVQDEREGNRLSKRQVEILSKYLGVAPLDANKDD